MRSARLRAAFVAALLGLASASADGQGPPPPPPPPLPPQLIDHVVGNIVANAAAPQVGEPTPQRSVFSLQTPVTEVQAGNPITLEIVRQGSDGKPYDFQLAFDPKGLVQNAPTAVSASDPNGGWKGEIATVENPPGTGPYALRILLLPGSSQPQIGVPRMVQVSVIRSPTFAVRAPDGAVQRGDPVTFTITRDGGTGEQRVAYNITQGNRLVETDYVAFDAGNSPRTVNLTTYEKCGEPPRFDLLGVKGETTATVAFPSELPPECITDGRTPPPTWVDVIENWWPVALIFPLGWLARRIFRRPKPNNGNRRDRPQPLPDLHSEFSIKAGHSSFPQGEPRLRLPEFEKSIGLIMGDSDWPRPLPLRETSDD